MVVIPRSCQIRRAVFGPRAGSRRNSATPAGTRSLRLVSASISPDSTICTIFDSIVFPIPGRFFASPASACSAIGPADERI